MLIKMYSEIIFKMFNYIAVFKNSIFHKLIFFSTTHAAKTFILIYIYILIQAPKRGLILTLFVRRCCIFFFFSFLTKLG